MAQRVGDRGTRTHKSTNGLRSSFEKCLYLRSIACATSGLAMITGKVGRGKWERRGEERRLERTEEGRDETRRDQSAARAPSWCFARDSTDSGVQSSPVQRRLRRSFVFVHTGCGRSSAEEPLQYVTHREVLGGDGGRRGRLLLIQAGFPEFVQGARFRIHTCSQLRRRSAVGGCILPCHQPK